MALDVYLIRNNNLTWVKYSAVADITITPTTPSGSAMRAYSQEYRNIFQSAIALAQATVGTVAGNGMVAEAVVPALSSQASNAISVSGSNTITISSFAGSPLSDEVSHADLRQTRLYKSFWKIDRGASAEPRYLYAEYQEGDIFARNPPQRA